MSQAKIRSTSRALPEQEEIPEKEEILYVTENPYRVLKVKQERITQTEETKKRTSKREDIGNIKSVLLNQFELTTMLSNQLNELKKRLRMKL